MTSLIRALFTGPLYLRGQQPVHSTWLDVLLFCVPVLCGLAAMWMGNYWG